MFQLHTMADALVKYETIDRDQIDDIMKGNTPKPPSDWSDHSSDEGDSSSEKSTANKKASADGKIGGPAGEH